MIFMSNEQKKYCVIFKNLETTIPEVKKKLRENSFCVIKKIILKKDLNYIHGLFKKRFKSMPEIRRSYDWKFKMKDFKRLDVGDSYKNSRFSRTITFSEWNKNNNEFYNIVDKIIKVRNALSNVKKNFFIYDNVVPFKRKHNKNKIFCDLVRMLQYPTGGGFLTQHNDFEKNYPEKIFPAILTVTSRKKRKRSHLSTYEKGGLYFIKNNKKMNVEDMMDSGDLVLFDQKISHGVNSVDPHKKIKLNELNGRITLAFSVGVFSKK